MKSIAIIIPYIGKLRPDFPFWLQSVKNNDTIDFFLFTDALVENPPENLHVIESSFEEINSRFQKIFDFKICIKSPYKYCDLKPSYGEAFHDILQGYDFWGHTDMDIVYGDLRKFLTDRILDQNDKIYGLGHFSLYRNTPSINSLYRKVPCPSYKQVFSFSEGCAFDEYYGIARYFDETLHNRFYQAYPFDDIDCTKGVFVAQMRRKELSTKEHFIYSYENGNLFRISIEHGRVVKDEIMYAHFQKRNMSVATETFERFLIIPNRFIDFKDDVTIEDVINLSKGKVYTIKRLKLLRDRFRNKLRKCLMSTMLNGFDKPKLPNSAKYYIEQ